MSAIADVCDDYGVELGAVAVQASLRDPLVDCTLIGMSRPERVAWTLSAASVPLPDELWERIAALRPSPEHWLDAQH